MKNSGRARRARQKLRADFAKYREDRQLCGEEPTTPCGAVRDERVPPGEQAAQPFPELVRRSIREGWATPDAAKPKVVAELLAPFYEADVAPRMHARLARTLLLCDETQHERDRAAEAGAVDPAVADSARANADAAAALAGLEEQPTATGATTFPLSGGHSEGVERGFFPKE